MAQSDNIDFNSILTGQPGSNAQQGRLRSDGIDFQSILRGTPTGEQPKQLTEQEQVETSFAQGQVQSLGENITPEQIEEIKAMMGGLEVPLVDPTLAGAGGFAAATKMAISAGSKVIPALGRGALSGFVGATTDFPIGQIADTISEDHPLLALPFAVMVGVVSGVTLERAIEQKVIAAFTKAGAAKQPQAVQEVVQQVQQAIQKGNPEEADQLLKLARGLTAPEVGPLTKAEQAAADNMWVDIKGSKQPKPGFLETAEDRIRLAEEAKAPGFLQSAEDLLKRKQVTVTEQVEAGAVKNIPDFDPVDFTPKTSALAPNEPYVRLPDGEQIIPGRLDSSGVETALELANRHAIDPEAVTKLDAYAGNINLDRINVPEDAKVLMDQIATDIRPLIKKATRGVVSQEDTLQKATLSGQKEGFLAKVLKRKPGKAWNAEDALAARMLNVASIKKINELRVKIQTEGGTDEELIDWLLMVERHRTLQASVSGITAEAGRALNAQKIVANAEGTGIKNFKAMIDALGGRELTEDMMRRLAAINPDDTLAVNRFLQEVGQATTFDKVYEVWINSLLSSPKTHLVNFFSNAMNLAIKIPEDAMAGGFDMVRAALTGKPQTRRAGEAAAELWSTTAGLQLGVKRMLHAWRTGMPSDLEAKLETRVLQSIKGKKGRLIRTPGRMLIAMDEFFKGVTTHIEMNRLAFRKAALTEGLTGKARINRIAKLVAEPTEDMIEAVRKEALYRTFQKPLGETGKKFLSLRNDPTTASRVLRVATPFVRTPTNILKFGLERTPLGFLRLLGKTKPGGADPLDVASRATLGTMVGAYAFSKAMDGTITGGGPKDPGERAALYEDTNWAPYSIKIGNNYYSYARLEPMGSVLGMAADLYEGWHRKDEKDKLKLATQMTTAISRNFTSKTWLRGPSDIVNTLSDPDRYAAPWLGRLLGTVVPRGIAGVATAIDDNLRNPETVGDYIRMQIPGLSFGLAMKRNLWGEPLTRPGGKLERALNPFRRRPIKSTKISSEMLRLDITPGKQPKTIRIDGKEVGMTPEEYDELVTRGGAKAKQNVSVFVNGKSYEGYSDSFKAKSIERRYQAGMKAARSAMKVKITQRVREERRLKNNGIYPFGAPVEERGLLDKIRGALSPSEAHAHEPPSIGGVLISSPTRKYKKDNSKIGTKVLATKEYKNKYDPLIGFTVKLEGGYVNAPSDKGGPTNFGISSKANPDIDVKNLTRKQAKVLYLERYMIPSGAISQPKGMDMVVFDTAVHSGVSKAKELLAKHKTIDSYLDARLKYIEKIAKTKKDQRKFLNGWRNRIIKIRRKAKTRQRLR